MHIAFQLNIPNWTTKQVTVNGADVNTSVTFTKQPTDASGAISVRLNTNGATVTLLNIVLSKNGLNQYPFNGNYSDNSNIVISNIEPGTYTLSIKDMQGRFGSTGSIIPLVGTFSLNKVTVKSGETSNVTLTVTK